MNKNHKKLILNFIDTLHTDMVRKLGVEDEEICVDYEKDDKKLNLIFDETMSYGYCYFQNGKFKAGQVDAQINEPWPQDLIDYVNQ